MESSHYLYHHGEEEESAAAVAATGSDGMDKLLSRNASPQSLVDMAMLQTNDVPSSSSSSCSVCCEEETLSTEESLEEESSSAEGSLSLQEASAKVSQSLEEKEEQSQPQPQSPQSPQTVRFAATVSCRVETFEKVAVEDRADVWYTTDEKEATTKQYMAVIESYQKHLEQRQDPQQQPQVQKQKKSRSRRRSAAAAKAAMASLEYSKAISKLYKSHKLEQAQINNHLATLGKHDATRGLEPYISAHSYELRCRHVERVLRIQAELLCNNNNNHNDNAVYSNNDSSSTKSRQEAMQEEIRQVALKTSIPCQARALQMARLDQTLAQQALQESPWKASLSSCSSSSSTSDPTTTTTIIRRRVSLAFQGLQRRLSHNGSSSSGNSSSGNSSHNVLAIMAAEVQEAAVRREQNSSLPLAATAATTSRGSKRALF